MKTHDSHAGFTLIELMVVVIIIAALAGMVLPRLLPVSDEAKKKIASGDIANVQVALKLYYLHNDRYPSSGAESLLSALYPQYLEKKPLDPWKRPYQYQFPGSHNTAGFDVWSFGSDGQDATDDDVTNWEE